MTSILRFARLAGACALSALFAAVPLHAAEPDMNAFTFYPVFKTEKVNPRIMVVMDNSGSMNFPAYGDTVEDWPNDKTIDYVYDGRICSQFSGPVKSTSDDGMQRKSNGEIKLCSSLNTLTMLDLDLGTDDDTYPAPNSACGKQTMLSAVRFSDVTIPRDILGVPVTVESAYIEFTARKNNGDTNFKKAALTLKITAQAADDPTTLTTVVNNISSRTNTAASVTWNVPGTAWTNGTTYQTPGPHRDRTGADQPSRLELRPGHAV